MPGPLTVHVAARLKDAVEAQGLTQAEVGVVIGQSQSQVSKYLRGEVSLDLEELAVLCRLLGLDAGTLVREALSDGAG